MTGGHLDGERAAQAAYQAELAAGHRAAAERTARLAELYDRPALGHYRRHHQPPPYPPGAPPLPPCAADWTAAQLAAMARTLAADSTDREVDAEVIIAIGRRARLPEADILAALRKLSP